jgi:hypothetical protein
VINRYFLVPTLLAAIGGGAAIYSCAPSDGPSGTGNPTNTPTATATPTATPTATATPTRTRTPITSCGAAPVTCGQVDPTDVGAGNINLISESKVTLSTSGVAYSMSFNTWDKAGQARVGVYTDSSPQSLIVQSDIIDITASANPVTYTTQIPNVDLAAGDYWLVLHTLSDGSGNNYHTYISTVDPADLFYYSISTPWGDLPSTISNGSWGSPGNAKANVMLLVCP